MHPRIRIFLLFMLLGTIGASVTAPFPVGAADAIPDVAPDTPKTVFFTQTGHAVGGAFLTYWKINGGVARFGFPVTDETVAKDAQAKNLTVQYFERARFEYHPEKAGTPAEVLLGQIGRESVGDRTDGPFRAVPENTKGKLDDEGAMWFRETQHTLAQGFRLYWEANGGLPIYGFPISQEFQEKNADDGKTYTVQYFERARFEWHPELKGGSVLIGLTGKADAVRAKANTAPRTKGTLVEWTPNMLDKWIEIDLSAQRLNAKVGNTTVWTTLVSTGKPGTPTPLGEYAVYTKLAKDDMTNGKAAGEDYYYLPDVPWVMYFIGGGYAIHGTYWHTYFGTVQSHGCVNVSRDGAKLLFDWAPLGTKVVVHE